MSKERLEEIDRVVDDLLNNRGELTNFVNDYYLQAERVQELENEYDILNQSLADVTGASGFMIKRVEQQNKRYRATINAMGQILKDAIHSLDVGEKVQGLEYGVKIAREALEESE